MPEGPGGWRGVGGLRLLLGSLGFDTLGRDLASSVADAARPPSLASMGARPRMLGRADAHLRPIIPTTEGAFWSTTETRNPPSVSAAEAFWRMLGTMSDRLAS